MMDLSPDQILHILVGVVVLVFSLVVHENAHALAAERFGDSTAREMGRITMNPVPHIDPLGTIIMPALMLISGVPLIGWARPVPINPSNFRNPVVHDAYVAAVGPMSNFALALGGTALFIVVALVFKHTPGLRESSGNAFLFFQLLCVNLIQINCILGIFNLIPVPPLDGHWILFMYLPSKWAAVLAAIRPYGFFILIALLWTGVLGRIIIVPMEFISGGLFGLVRTAVAAL
jgi:Zn-dependent protease